MGYTGVAQFLFYAFSGCATLGPFKYDVFREQVTPQGYDHPFCKPICSALGLTGQAKDKAVDDLAYYIANNNFIAKEPCRMNKKKHSNGKAVWEKIADQINSSGASGSLGMNILAYLKSLHRQSSACAYKYFYSRPQSKWDEIKPPNAYAHLFGPDMLEALFGRHPDVLVQGHMDSVPEAKGHFVGMVSAVHQRCWEAERRQAIRAQKSIGKLVDKALKTKECEFAFPLLSHSIR